jgi:hypothetical protein
MSPMLSIVLGYPAIAVKFITITGAKYSIDFIYASAGGCEHGGKYSYSRPCCLRHDRVQNECRKPTEAPDKLAPTAGSRPLTAKSTVPRPSFLRCV